MNPFHISDRPLLLDGGMGRELRFRGVDMMRPSWSAMALLSSAEIVKLIHVDYVSRPV